MISLVIFDMAGTVVDENNVVYKSIHKVMVNHDYGISFEEVLHYAGGQEKKEAIKSLLKMKGIEFDEEKIESLFVEFKEILMESYENLPMSPMPFTNELFKILNAHGIKTALNTGYDRPTAELIIERLGWKIGVDFDHLVAASEVPRARPFPDMILKIMEDLDITNPDHIVKVGDTIIDIEEGKNANCRINVGVCTGAHSREMMLTANPEYIIDTLEEFISILESENTAI
jgi:phosphonatase-like hydrolase